MGSFNCGLVPITKVRHVSRGESHAHILGGRKVNINPLSEDPTIVDSLTMDPIVDKVLLKQPYAIPPISRAIKENQMANKMVGKKTMLG